MAGLAGWHHGALSVTDLDASVGWYSEVFGFHEIFRQESESRRTAVLRFPGSGDTLGLVQHRDPGVAFDPRNVGLDHLALGVESGDDLDEWARLLGERGVDNSGVIETPFGGMLHFTDRDGIALALFWERARRPGGSSGT